MQKGEMFPRQSGCHCVLHGRVWETPFGLWPLREFFSKNSPFPSCHHTVAAEAMSCLLASLTQGALPSQAEPANPLLGILE